MRKRATFSIENGMKFDGWHDTEKTWNGWAVPWLDRNNIATRLIPWLNENYAKDIAKEFEIMLDSNPSQIDFECGFGMIWTAENY